MSKFSWDDYPDFDVVAMDDDGEVNVYEGEVYRSDGDYSWWNEFGTDVLKIFAPAKQVDHGRVEPVYKPNLPPDWWFEDESGEGQTTDEERFDAEGLADHVSGVDSNTYAVGSLDSTGLEWDSRGGQKEYGQYIGAPGSKSTGWVGSMSYANMMQHYGAYLMESELSALPQDWTTNDTLGSSIYKTHAELAKQAIWAHFEEFECLPDFLVGDTEVLGPFFMGIKVIDDGEA